MRKQLEQIRNSVIIKSIQILLSALKNMDDHRGLCYLLGQSIRQYDVPKENHHVSEAANNLWKKLTQGSIDNFHYRDTVKCDNLKIECKVKSYIGNSSKEKEKTLHPNETFVFRELFHEDHVIPVSIIIKNLLKLPDIDEKSIKDCLDKMHLCVLLKEEDRKIGRTRNRGNDCEQIIRDVYNKAGIYLVKQ